MDNFKVLTETELESLSSKERREYQKQLKEYNNRKMVEEIVHQTNDDDTKTPTVAPSTQVSKSTVSSSPKKSNAGRKKIDASEKKQQIMLTIEADTKAQLETFDEKKYKKLLARYIDKNIDAIINAMEQL